MRRFKHNIDGIQCDFKEWSQRGGLIFDRHNHYWELLPNLDWVRLWDNEVRDNLHPLNLPINKELYLATGELRIEVQTRYDQRYWYKLEDGIWKMAS